MADSKQIVPFFYKWEGGLSRNENDSASDFPCPYPYKGVVGWHTNKGVTWETFVSNSEKLGYAATADNFFRMPHEIWHKIFKKSYWDVYDLDNCKYQSIANVIVSWSWGSGAFGAEVQLARFQRDVMGINDSNITKTEIVENFNALSPSKEKEIFDKLCDWRESFFRKIARNGGNSKFLNGWLNRLNAFRKAYSPVFNLSAYLLPVLLFFC